MMTTAASTANRKRKTTVIPAATGAADSLCALTGELVAVVGERDGDSRDGDRRPRDGLMSFVAADDRTVELKANVLVGTVKKE